MASSIGCALTVGSMIVTCGGWMSAGLLMLMAVWRIRKELINLNCKIDLLTQPSKIESEKETEKEPQKEFGQVSKNEVEKEPEAQDDNELEKRKYRYKWK